MNDTEFNDLLEDLRVIGHLGPLTRFGQDLNDVEELPTKGYMKGARVFFDPKTNSRYISFLNGYVRRYVPTVSCFGHKITSKYYLNPRQTRRNKKRGDSVGNIKKSTIRVCGLLPEEEDRIQLIVRGIRNYRNTLMVTLKK